MNEELDPYEEELAKEKQKEVSRVSQIKGRNQKAEEKQTSNVVKVFLINLYKH